MSIKLAALTNTQALNTQIALYSVAFLFPLLYHGNQLFLGSLVNLILFIGARTMNRGQLVGLVVLPSLAAVGNGVLFGSLTPFLIYLLPFIWVGNWIMVSLAQTSLSASVRVGLAASGKALFLYLAAQLLFNLGLVPALFLTAMGVVQLVTALFGGAAVIGLEKIGAIKYER